MEALRNVFMKKVVDEAEINNKIVVLDCDMARHTKTSFFKEKYPDRFFEAGIAEQNAIGIAAGIAKGGMIPIVSSFAAFICGRTWEQIRHSIGYNDSNVKIFATHAGLSAGEDGGTHQCAEDIALMATIPNIEIFAPAFPSECKKICEYVINSSKAAYIRVGRESVSYDFDCQIGDPILIGNENAKYAIISTGEVSAEGVKVVERNDNVKLIHIGCLRPMSSKVKEMLHGVERAVVVEEHTKFCGLASILYVNGFLDKINLVHLSMGESYGQTGTISELRKCYGLDSLNIENKLLRK